MKVDVPLVVGVPLIMPVERVSVSPAGSEPDVTLHVYGVVPPVAFSVCEYDEPTVPPTSDVLLTARVFVAPTMIVIGHSTQDELLSVTRTVNVAVPAVVGVPVIAPVVGLIVRPAGSAPEVTVHVYGVVPPLTWSVCE